MTSPHESDGALVTIDLFGGPHDGKSAPHDSAYWPMRLDQLMYLPDPPKPELGPKARVPIQMCSYAHRERGIYDFDVAEDRTMLNSDYLALKQAQDLFAKLRSLAADPRLLGRPEAEARRPPGVLPIPEARELKEKALPRYRRWLQGLGQPVERLSDEEIWGILRARLLGDLAWADIGVVAHFDSLRDFAFDILDIDLPIPEP